MPTKPKGKHIDLILSPCPFCGEDAQLEFAKEAGSWVVACGHCGAKGPDSTGLSMEESASYWNAREKKNARDILSGDLDED